jgi:O-antigen ligase
MSQILRGKRVSEIVEFLYATTALFLLTQGPVYTLWKPSALEAYYAPQATVSLAYFATFALVQMPGVVMAIRRFPSALFSRASFRALLLLLLWLTATSLISTLARKSVPEILALLLSTGFGVYLAVSFRMRTLLWQLVVAMTVGCLWSYVAVIRLWDGSRNIIDGYWIGIYLNRNSLAPVAAVGVVAAILLVQPSGLRLRSSVIPAAGLLMVAVGCGVVFFQSESSTALVALLIACGTTLVWCLVQRTLGQRISTFTSGRTLVATFSIVAVMVAVMLRTIVTSGSLFGRVETFSERSTIWSLNWSGFLQRPIFGWGWMAAWDVPHFRGQGVWWAVSPDNSWAHSGYFDLLLGGGVVAIALFVFWVVASYLNVEDRPQASSQDKSQVLAAVTLSLFVLAMATQESFFVGSHFLWVTLVASLILCQRSTPEFHHPLNATS